MVIQPAIMHHSSRGCNICHGTVCHFLPLSQSLKTVFCECLHHHREIQLSAVQRWKHERRYGALHQFTSQSREPFSQSIHLPFCTCCLSHIQTQRWKLNNCTSFKHPCIFHSKAFLPQHQRSNKSIYCTLWLRFNEAYSLQVMEPPPRNYSWITFNCTPYTAQYFKHVENNTGKNFMMGCCLLVGLLHGVHSGNEQQLGHFKSLYIAYNIMFSHSSGCSERSASIICITYMSLYHTPRQCWHIHESLVVSFSVQA